MYLLPVIAQVGMFFFRSDVQLMHLVFVFALHIQLVSVQTGVVFHIFVQSFLPVGVAIPLETQRLC